VFKAYKRLTIEQYWNKKLNVNDKRKLCEWRTDIVVDVDLLSWDRSLVLFEFGGKFLTLQGYCSRTSKHQDKSVKERPRKTKKKLWLPEEG